MLRIVRVLAFLLPGVMVAATGTVTQTFQFEQSDFMFGKVNGYDVVTLVGPGTRYESSLGSIMPAGCSTSEPGFPNLPLAVYYVAIPPDAEVTGVDVVSASTAALSGQMNIYPSQPPQALANGDGRMANGVRAFVPPDPTVYASAQAYPAEMVRSTRSGLMGGYRIAAIQFFPLRYFPAQKRLELVTRATVAVHYERNRHDVVRLDESQVDLMGQSVRALVRNPEQVSTWSPPARITLTADSTCDMMVITSTAFAPSFQPFVNWKTRRGIKTTVVKTESIYSTYSGRDQQEKIRNCVKDYWQNHGLKWLLLGGDDGTVPVRTCQLTVEGTTEDIASDMYYADLQYTWDSNNNGIFGEMEDSVDLFYDVYVGRVPADGAADIATFFAKDTMFEKHQDTTRQKRVLYGSTMLFDPYHGKVINHIIANTFPSGWTHVHLEDPSGGVYADSMSKGFQLAHVAAHGNPFTFSVMDSSEVPGLTNGFTRLNFVNSIACESGWFDGTDCLAEALVNAPNGGCVACMLNSRYGFGYPPALGPSELLDLQFYRYFVQGYATQFGTLGMLSKDYFHSLAMDQSVWRWCVYELNLFGDPSLLSGPRSQRPSPSRSRIRCRPASR